MERCTRTEKGEGGIERPGGGKGLHLSASFQQLIPLIGKSQRRGVLIAPLWVIVKDQGGRGLGGSYSYERDTKKKREDGDKAGY